jgi:hypothetical protein
MYVSVKPTLGKGNLLSFQRKNLIAKRSNATLFLAIWISLKMCLVELECGHSVQFMVAFECNRINTGEMKTIL